MPSKRKKNEARKAKKKGGEEAKSKSQKLSRNFAFCACPNFAS